MFLLRQHHRKPLPFSLDLLDAARTERQRFLNFLHDMAARPEGPRDPAVAEAITEARAAFRAALEDDLNTAAAFATLFGFVKDTNRRAPSAADAADAVAFLRECDRVLGVLDDPDPDDLLDADVERLIEERNAARKRKDFARADAIRDELAAKGIDLLDGPQGVRWKRR
jgi:cysteinyl-tRNA synthetase